MSAVPAGWEVVERFWPYDGAGSPEQVAEAAAAVSSLVRYLNNATGPGRAARTLPYAASVHRVLGGLSGAVWGLPQLLDQLRAVTREQESSVYDDRGDRAGSVTAAALLEQLSSARTAAYRLGEELSAAGELSGHLGNHLEDSGPLT